MNKQKNKTNESNIASNPTFSATKIILKLDDLSVKNGICPCIPTLDTKLKEKYSDYVILQAHPNNWTPEKLEEFNKIIDFLLSEGCEFVLPYEYYKISAIQ